MYNIIQVGDNKERQQNMSFNSTSNATKSVISNGAKVDCAKECPCGVPAIPVPDQWLEVMVTGGFKVWHIIFIIIAFVVTLIVVYCCFHRCRIPRTKQEIEADLMRSNLANKFRDYLLELPNEPTTFLDALKKVQEIEEKLEQDDAMLSRDLGARKRMGWLKLKGKDKPASGVGGGEITDNVATATTAAMDAFLDKTDQGTIKGESEQVAPSGGAVQTDSKLTIYDKEKNLARDSQLEAANAESRHSIGSSHHLKAKEATSQAGGAKSKNKKALPDKRENVDDAKLTKDVIAESSNRPESKARQNLSEDMESKSLGATATVVAKTATARVKKKRDKPNLSRTKAANVKSIEHNQLELPQVVQHHHQRHHHHQKPVAENDYVAPQTSGQPLVDIIERRHRSRSKHKETRKGSVIVQMNS